MNTTLAPTPHRFAVAGSVALVYLRMTALTVAAVFAVFGGGQLAARSGVPLLVAVTVTALGVAGAELFFPGVVTRGTLPHRTAQTAALAAVVVTWVALAAVIVPAGSDAIAQALDSLLALTGFAAVFMGVYVARAFADRDPRIIPAYRTGR